MIDGQYFFDQPIKFDQRWSSFNNPKAIQQINLTGNLDWDRNTTKFFIIEETKDVILDFSQGAMRIL